MTTELREQLAAIEHETATSPPPLTDLVGLDPNFTGGLSAQDHLARQYGAVTSAERAVIDAARAWRECRAIDSLEKAGLLIAAVDALGVPAQRAAQ